MISASSRWRKTIRRLAVMALAAAMFMGVAVTPASAGSWSFNLKTKDARPGGQTIGTVHYKAGSGCYDVHVTGTVKDIEADGWGVVVDINGLKCNGSGYGLQEIGYVGGNGKSKPLSSRTFKGMKDARISVCLYKNGWALHGCRDS